ncbi:hypothetical protein OIE62_24920 [Streptomyces scopuliridis]|uniref:Uncharacterized protein n=1 Tax=Streptomyces scopuliridis TaxID=452529 RepID=A0ACD4ZJ99_9ACTN|nr:hypothetical protein [Streptomyces scopuliridis]WSB98382.1 hypothetical protein OG835_16020 [Streptomyces scopuliridis]WSC07916.1 hypothetical protein OIE62_24920 [Streptomyces scopuliridis]
MLQYKEQLQFDGPDDMGAQNISPRAGIIRAYRHFQKEIDAWGYATASLSLTNLEAIELSSIGVARDECARKATFAKRATDQLCDLPDDTVRFLADYIFGWYLSWANDVFDLRYPDFSETKEDRDSWIQALNDARIELHMAVCDMMDLDPKELTFSIDSEGDEEPPAVSIGTLPF